MEIIYATDELKRLAEDAYFDAGFSRDIVKLYRKRVQSIAAANDERVFYAMKGWHFEKLKGDRKEQYSMRLNLQWRLLLNFQKNDSGKFVILLSIEDYH